MTRIHFHQPPELTEHAAMRSLGPCIVCLMFAKGDQITRTREMWEPLANDGHDDAQKWYEYAEHYDIREAVLVGMNDQIQGLLMPLCWDHLAPMARPDPRALCGWCHGSGRKQSKQIEAASGPLPPAFKNGKRGVG